MTDQKMTHDDFRKLWGEAGTRDFPEDFAHENGNYTNTCGECGYTFTGHKRRVVCKVCRSAALTAESMTPPEFRKLWVEALESGDFAQARSQLRTSANTFCCLGVASELYKRHIDKSMHWYLSKYDLCYGFGPSEEDSNAGFLHKVVADFMGTGRNRVCVRSGKAPAVMDILKKECPDVASRLKEQNENKFFSLATLNDNGVSFAIIAKLIREVPEAFFKDAS